MTLEEYNSFPDPLPCPDCGWIPLLNLVDAKTEEPTIQCMNCTCNNMTRFTDKNLGKAIALWDAWVINNNKNK